MKKLKLKRKILFLIISCFSIPIQKHKTFSIAAIRHAYFSIDPLLSSQTQNTIMALMDTLHNSHYNPIYLSEYIPQRFPCVKSISFAYKGNGIACVSIEAHKPVAYINETLIAAENGSLFNASTYQPQLELFSLQANTELLNHDATKLIDCIQSITNAHMSHEYHITWHSPYHVDLYDPLTHIHLICTSQIFEHPYDINDFKQTIMNKIIPSGTAETWIADIRFKDQIIMAMEKRGQYGKNI